MSENQEKSVTFQSVVLDEVGEVIRQADALFITAGAGMGVDSGLPTFRGNKGFWGAYPDDEKSSLSFYELANPQWFHRDPDLAWAFYGQRLNQYRDAIPHSGFQQLLEIAESRERGYFVFTSNVDGQFQKAGFDDDNIIECHGSIHYLQCLNRCCETIWPATEVSIEVDHEEFRATGQLPTCNRCGGLARPNIYMFQDYDWIEQRNEKKALRMFSWWNRLRDNNQKVAVIELGAGTAIPTVRRKSESLVSSYDGSTLIRVNPQDFDVPDGGYAIPVGAVEGLDIIYQILKSNE